MSSEPDTAFLLRRAEEEAILAIRTDQTPAAPAHYELARLYSARALQALGVSSRPEAPMARAAPPTDHS